MTREGQETKVFLSDLLTKPALDRDGPLSLVPCGIAITPFVSSL